MNTIFLKLQARNTKKAVIIDPTDVSVVSSLEHTAYHGYNSRVYMKGTDEPFIVEGKAEDIINMVYVLRNQTQFYNKSFVTLDDYVTMTKTMVN